MWKEDQDEGLSQVCLCHLLHALAFSKGLPSGLVSPPTPVAAPTGRLEWVRFQEAEYKFFEHHSSWAQAQRICTWFQAELTSVHSQAELDFLGQNMQKVGVRGSKELCAGKGPSTGKPLSFTCFLSQLSSDQEQHWWIGLHTSESDGRFRWEH